MSQSPGMTYAFLTSVTRADFGIIVDDAPTDRIVLPEMMIVWFDLIAPVSTSTTFA